MKTKFSIAIALIVALGLGFVLGVVAGRWVWKAQHDRANTEVAEPGDVTDRALMVALDQAKNFHHQAKVYMSDGNLAAATASVRQILSLRFPPNAPEAEDVRLDARALLAKLLVSQGQLEEAMRTVDEGIAQSTRKSFFLANVYTVKGEIYESRALQADAAGNPAKAAEDRHAAINEFAQSIQINEALQKQLEDQ